MTVSTFAMPGLVRTQRFPASATVETPIVSSDAPTDSDARELAAAIRRGDESAFRRLYDLYHDRLLRFSVVLARGDELLARETVQSVFIVAASSLNHAESESHLWNWLARVARQQLLKTWRQQQRHAALITRATPADPPAAPDADAKAEAELEESLDAALLRLDPDDRQIIEWFYFDHLSHKEMAGRLNSSAKAISSRLERARARLKTALKRKLSE